MIKATITAIIAVAVLEGFAIWKGIDGASLASAFAIIGGLGGYGIFKHRSTKQGGK